MILGLSAPGEGELLASSRESDPLAFRCGFGFLREEAAGQPDVDALTGKLHGSAGNAGSGQGQSDALFARRGYDGKSDFEQQHGAPRMRQERGELAAGFASGAGHKRDELSVKPGFANEQTGRNRDAY